MALNLRPMTPADISLGMRLKELAGWNQTPADWQMLLDAGSGLVAEVDGAGVGTATILEYDEAFSWVGMVLVDPAFQRRGIGTALLDAAIVFGQRRGAVRLDATPQGERLYRGLGFEDEYGLLRMRRPAAAGLVATAPDSCNTELDPLDPEAIRWVAAYDAPVFGAGRQRILGALYARAPRYAFRVVSRDRLTGYCLGRRGSECDQIGPLVASDAGTAQSLLLAALANSGHRGVFVDVPAGRLDWIGALEELGFAPERPFTRMCLGGGYPFGDPEKQFATAGAELG
jgi:GNAT superfamily N-acetyltransferase